MKPSRQLRGVLLAGLLGLVLGLWLPMALSLLSFGIALCGFYLRANYGWVVWGILSLGAAYQSFYAYHFYPDNLFPLLGQSVEFKATVQGEARVRDKRQTVRLKIKAWRQEGRDWKDLSGQILWQQAPLPPLNAGDEIAVQGVVSNLTNFSTDFNAQAYWARWGIAHNLIRGKMITRPPARRMLSLRWRNQAKHRLQRHLSRPHLTVALGMLVGLKEKLPKTLEQSFKASGLQHLLVVSGTNVTLLVLALSLLLKPLGPWWRYGLGILVILSYLYLVGFEPPALRASLFGIITGLALTSGNFCEYRNLFLLVAALLGLYDPRFITHDVSFWLSFSATAGILFGVPLMYQAFRFIRWKGFRLLLAASFCAQMAVFPILIIEFGSFPYIGLFTNLITEPLVPLIMFMAAGALLIGSQVFLGLALLWDQILWISIEGLLRLAQGASLAPEIFIPVWVGFIWALGLVLVGVWGSFSLYYQQHYWERMEAEIS